MSTNSTETDGYLSRNFDGFNGRVLLTAVVIFFIILIASITLQCLNRCLLGRHITSDGVLYQTNSAHQENDQPSHSGLHPSVIAALPVVAYQKVGMVVECVVCLGELDEGENVHVLPRCLHPFHVDCINMWLFTHSSCPVCRANAELPDSFRFPESSVAVAMAGLGNPKEVGSASGLRSSFRRINGEDLSERSSQPHFVE